MSFDEANAAITEQLTGRTIEHVVRNGLVLEFHTTCGHVGKLHADVEFNIRHRGTDGKIILPDVAAVGVLGMVNGGAG